jgi:competence protein ComEA
MRSLLFLAVLLCSLGAQAQEKPQLPDGPGKATVMRLCSKCHGAQIVLGRQHSEEGWGAIVADMAQRGMEATDDEMYEVVQYLAKYIKALPKINVNKATAKDLMSLSFSDKEAEAIVQAREKAEFKSIDDLKKVSGIEAAKVDAVKGRLSF